MAAVIILAIVQGLTEFLPVSSDGHLVLAGYLLGSIDQRFLDFVIFLHGGSLLVIVTYYFRDLVRMAQGLVGAGPEVAEQRRLILSLGVATVITGVLGILAKDTIEQLQHPAVAACGLLFTGAELLTLKFVKPGTRTSVSVPLAIVIGLFQTLAILPGVSRSASTITVGLWGGLLPGTAAAFSFLLAIPAIGGALLLDLRHFQTLPVPALHLAVGFVVCTVVSWIALRLVLHYVQRGKISNFGFYCIALGLGFLAWLYLL